MQVSAPECPETPDMVSQALPQFGDPSSRVPAATPRRMPLPFPRFHPAPQGSRVPALLPVRGLLRGLRYGLAIEVAMAACLYGGWRLLLLIQE